MSVKYSESAKKNKPRPTVKQLYALSNRNSYYLLSAMILYTAILYFNTIYNGFVNWDDTQFIFENTFIRNYSWEGVKDLFTNSYCLNYQPLTMLTWMFEYKHWGFSPDVYHLHNLILHLFNIFLIYTFARLLTGNKTISLLTSFFFAVHPLHVESVAWVSERKDVLYTFFFFLSLIFYLYYLKNNYKITFLLLSFAFFLLSLFSKAMAVSLPLVLLIIDHFYFSRKVLSRRCILEKIPFVILSFIFCIVGYVSQRSGGGLSELSGTYSLLNRLFFIPYAISFYLIHCILPLNLSIFHYYPEVNNGFLPVEYYLSPLFAGVIIWLISKANKNHKYVLPGFLFFIVTVLPVLQIIPIGKVIVSERYSYVPYTGLFLVLFTYLERFYNNSKKNRKYLYILLAIVSISFSVMTWNRIKVWQRGTTLWSDFVSKQPGYYYGYYGLAGANYSKEIANYNKYVNQYKTNFTPYGGTEIAKDDWNDLQDAVINFSKAISLKPAFADAYLGRGNAFLDLNESDKALSDYNKVIEINPKDQRAYNNRAAIYYKLHKYDLAIADYNKLLSLNPVNASTYFNRGLLYMTEQDTVKACEDFQKAKSLKSNIAEQFIERLCK